MLRNNSNSKNEAGSKQTMKTNTLISSIGSLVLPIMALTFTGCWTPPNANVEPKGQAGLIQDGILTQSVKDPATIVAIDASQRTLGLKLSDGTTITGKAGPKVKHFDELKVGDKVKAKVIEELAVYVVKKDQTGKPVPDIVANAKVQQVDPSYRLVILQYPDGHTEEVKLGLNTKLKEMSPGDSVVIRTGEVTAIRVEK
jgi:hypothetical protein